MRDVQAELCQAESLELNGLSRHAARSSVNEGAVLVNHIDDGDQLTGVGAKVNKGDAANFNEVLGWLLKSIKW